MNPWWRRPSAESASSATNARNEQKAESRSRRGRSQKRTPDDEERSSSNSRSGSDSRSGGESRGRRRGGRGRGRRSSEKQSRGRNERSQEKSQSKGREGRSKEKKSRIAVILDLSRASEGYGSCDWKPESASELIDRALQSTLGAPNGSRIYLRAYAPWEKFEADSAVLDEAGVERIDSSESGTVRMVVDAVERSYGRNPCDTFVLISASDELAPLAERLRERKRTVHACGFRAHATPALEEACSSFAFLDDEPKIVEEPVEEPKEESRDKKSAPAARARAKTSASVDPFALLHQAAESVAGEGGAVWGTLVRQTMQSMHPGFTETDHGYSNFAAMLEEAQRRGIVALERDSRSDTYYLSGLATAS